MKVITANALLGLALGAAMLSAPAFASPVSAPSDIIKWYATVPGGGYSLFESITLNEDGSSVLFVPGNGPGTGTFYSPGFGTESVVVGSCLGCNDVAIGLLEPGSGLIGDMFTSLTTEQGDQAFMFTSVEKGSIPFPSDPFLPEGKPFTTYLLNETNGPIDIASYVFGPDSGYILTIQSDVPEPATWTILLGMLLGMGVMIGAARRRAPARSAS
jgi:hypothetical protein